jgi:hypothetical protein
MGARPQLVPFMAWPSFVGPPGWTRGVADALLVWHKTALRCFLDGLNLMYMVAVAGTGLAFVFVLHSYFSTHG